MKRVASEELIQWYKIHDLLIGKYHQCIVTALNISNVCKHPDAIHLNKILYMVPLNETISTLKLLTDDRIALYFYGIMSKDYSAVEKSANLGYIHAKRVLLRDNYSLELYNLGERTSCALSDKKDDLIYAAELGSVFAMQKLQKKYDRLSVNFWKYCCMEVKTRRSMIPI